MSSPTYVVVPVEHEAGQTKEQENTQGARIVSAIQRSMNEGRHPEHQPEHEGHGPLKAMLDNRRSIYSRYVSWEDPLRTLCSYLGVLSILTVAHYMPFMHLALKAGVITLMATAAMEFASRAFGPNTFLARLRPQPYKTIPEDTLNATLKDIHDLIQYSVREAQKIVFAQELDKTLLTALGLGTALFLSSALSPFSFSVLALTTVYVGSLAASSAPSLKDVARRAKEQAGNAKHAAPANPVKPKEGDNQTQDYAHVPAKPSAEAHGESQQQQREDAAGAQKKHDAADGRPQRAGPGQESREANAGQRSADGRAGESGSPAKPFPSAIPLATAANGGHRHPGSSL